MRHSHPNGILDYVSASLEITGDVVRFRTKFSDPIRKGNRRRGQVKGFSRAARKRMLTYVSQLDWSKNRHGLFITVTYPDLGQVPDKEARKQHRYVFFRSMENHLGRQVAALWRIEWEVRKSGRATGQIMPHFHMMVFNVSYIPWQLVRSWWRQAIGHDCEVLATDVKRLSSKRHHHNYIAKYCAKAQADSLEVLTYGNIDGRHWGVHRSGLIPMHPTIIYAGLSPEQIDTLQCLAYEMFPWYGRHGELGFTAFGEKGREIQLWIMELLLDGPKADD